MRVKPDSTGPNPSGDEAAELLARRLSDQVRARRLQNGNQNGANGGGRELALEIGAAMLADASAGTAEHSDDVVLITEAIGERMGVAGTELADLLAAARLHDIGKTWVPSSILEKAGPLSDEEWKVMRQHTVVGERILSTVEELRGVARLVRHSHERWDGRGYPDGLAGAQIPQGSRIIFCADSFHAIRSDRPYRPGRSAREALAEIKRCAGTQFDPDVVTELERVMRERSQRPRGGRTSSRLFALLICLTIGGAGSAVARSGVLGEPGPPPPSAAPKPPPACGTAACPTVAGPVGGLGPVGALDGSPGARALFPGLPGLLHREQAPGQLKPKGESAQGKGRGEKSRGEGKGSEHRHNGHHAKGGANGQGAEHSASAEATAPAYSHSSAGGSGGGTRGSSHAHSGASHRGGGHGGSSHGRDGGSARAGGNGGGAGSGGSNGNRGGASGSHGR